MSGKLIGFPQILAGPTGEYASTVVSVDASAKNPVLTRTFDEAGNEFIYLKGVASTVATDFVTYDELGVTARLGLSASGPLAVAMAATVANTWGWYQIGGLAQANTGTIADNSQLYATSTAGRADDLANVGEQNRLVGVTARSTATANVATVQLDNPRVGVMPRGLVTEYASDGAITPVHGGMAVLTKGSAGAYTLAAPTAGVDDGLTMTIVAGTSFAHVVTGTNLFWAGETGGPFNKITTAAFIGSAATIKAWNGLWLVVSDQIATVGD